jgi:hypothetical protein
MKDAYKSEAAETRFEDGASSGGETGHEIFFSQRFVSEAKKIFIAV